MAAPERTGEEGEREASQDATVLFVGGLAALVTALLALLGNEPLVVVLLANLAGLAAVAGAGRAYVEEQPNLFGTHAAVAGAALLGALAAVVTGVFLTGAVLALVGAMSAGRVYEMRVGRSATE